MVKVSLIANNQQRTADDMVAALDGNALLIRHARDHGWDGFMAAQHYLNDGDICQMQQVPFLARMQAEAGEMTMGVAIHLLPLMNPVLVAETMATLDIIAGGRLVLGVGLGYREVEYEAFGVARGQRVRRFEDGLDLLKRLWTEEAVSFESDYCRLDNVRMNLRPVQQPHPPLWLAGNSDNAVRRAARLGDCWYVNPHATMDTNVRQMHLYRDELDRLGRPYPAEIPCRKEIFCAKDMKTALAMAAPYIGEKYRIYTRWGQHKEMPEGETFDMPFEELAKERFIIGSPEDCYEQLRPHWERLGATHFVFRTWFIGMPVSLALQSMRLISGELLPALRKATPTPLAELPAA